MIRVTVPATSANMGSGFDTIGIALSLSNEVLIDENDHLDISCKTGHNIHADTRNLIFRCARRVYDEVGKLLHGLTIVESCNIPMTRGLGSSSACTVAGVMGANALLKNPLNKQDVIDLCAVIEGHPDNSTPAILGGFVAALLEDGKVWQVRVPIAKRLQFCVFVPDFELKTEKARAALPSLISHKDAVFNLARAALLAGSLVSGDLHNIGVATEDRLHQPYRFGFIPQGEEIMQAARQLGALGVYLSGAGPSIIAIVNDTTFGDRASIHFAQHFPSWKVLTLECDEVGAVVEII